ncbi:hypothetical protein POD11_04275 [Acinetobacter sp. P1(2023)]|jgi:hypothetical protein|uniref:hypothetical protein n=1 Tax=Acinetobacter TaxID=469 RepID=UPI0003A3698D|nr:MULTISPECIES: hypothetical protein [Acinetobacter]MDC0841474.1 hypothetical protein [Acinetobacter sp. P1(2023)]MDX8237913.1 hypothetical protein [Acinetobacter pittii]
MTGMRGAQANHAKKQAKKASQLMWKARIAGTVKLNSLIDVAFVADKFKDIAFTPTERNFFVHTKVFTNSIRTDFIGRL